jgi:hypothetical protein
MFFIECGRDIAVHGLHLLQVLGLKQERKRTMTPRLHKATDNLYLILKASHLILKELRLHEETITSKSERDYVISLAFFHTRPVMSMWYSLQALTNISFNQLRSRKGSLSAGLCILATRRDPLTLQAAFDTHSGWSGHLNPTHLGHRQ